MIDLKNKEISDQVVQYLLSDPLGDRGQYDVFVNLVEKYGVVPKQAYPETVASSSIGRLNWMVTVKL
jgi:bleomycin hydrolase